MALSLVLEAFRKKGGAKQGRGQLTPQVDRSPTLPGVARGTMGVTGSRPLQTRNVDAALMRDREQLAKSPVMQAFLRRKRERLI